MIKFLEQKKKNITLLLKIIECNTKGQPVLVGTTSIEKSEKISKLLDEKN